MKAAIAVLLTVGAVAAAAALGAAAPDRTTVGSAATAGCSFADLPRAAARGEQTLYGRIRSLARVGRGYRLRFDPAWFLTGSTAARAALEDTGSADVPNDVYVRDESHKTLAFRVPANAETTVLRHATCSTRITVARLANAIPRAGFWIRVRGDAVRSLDQQYRP